MVKKYVFNITQRHGYQGECMLKTINEISYRVKKYSKYVFCRVLRLSGPYCWSLPVRYLIAWNFPDSKPPTLALLQTLLHLSSLNQSVFSHYDNAIATLCFSMTSMFNTNPKRSFIVNSCKRFLMCLFHAKKKKLFSNM